MTDPERPYISDRVVSVRIGKDVRMDGSFPSASERLRALVAEATNTEPLGMLDPQPERMKARRELQDLSPQLAVLCADMGEALALYADLAGPWEHLFSGEDLRNFQQAEAVLARLDALFGEDVT